MRRFIVKPIFLLVLLSTIFVSSCNKEADIHEADLIGTWDIGQAAVDIKVGPLSLFQFLRTTLLLSEQEAQDYVNGLISEYDYISGGTISFHLDYSYVIVNGDFEEHGTWELEGEKMYLTVSGEVPDYEPLVFEKLNSSSAYIVWEDDQEVDMDEDGNGDFTATLVIELSLSKQ